MQSTRFLAKRDTLLVMISVPVATQTRTTARHYRWKHGNMHIRDKYDLHRTNPLSALPERKFLYFRPPSDKPVEVAPSFECLP